MPREELQRRYKAALKSLTLDDIVDSVSIPLYEHSLESMSRDFPATPIFAVFQPLWHSQEEYTRMTNVIPSKVNDQDHYADIKFLNLQRVWEEHNFFPGSLVNSVHLSNEGHKLVTTYLSDYLFPFVQQRCVEIATAKAAPSPRADSPTTLPAARYLSLQARVQGRQQRHDLGVLQIRREDLRRSPLHGAIVETGGEGGLGRCLRKTATRRNRAACAPVGADVVHLALHKGRDAVGLAVDRGALGQESDNGSRQKLARSAVRADRSRRVAAADRRRPAAKPTGTGGYGNRSRARSTIRCESYLVPRRWSA